MSDRRGVRFGFVFIAAVIAVAALYGCRAYRAHRVASRPKLTNDSSVHEYIVTGYCNCGKCCGWRRRWYWFGEPVYDYGTMKGKPKLVGITASGTVARHGTIAADPALLKFGTRLEIPGYGIGTVEDIGGAIKGRHIDLWFPSHAEARRWGVRKLQLKEIRK